jgi:hypothetical protein
MDAERSHPIPPRTEVPAYRVKVSAAAEESLNDTYALLRVQVRLVLAELAGCAAAYSPSGPGWATWFERGAARIEVGGAILRCAVDEEKRTVTLLAIEPRGSASARPMPLWRSRGPKDA